MVTKPQGVVLARARMPLYLIGLARSQGARSCVGRCWVLSVFVLVYRVLSGFIGFYRVLSGFIGFYRVLSGFIGFYRVLSGFIGFIGFYRALVGFGWLW